MIRIRRKTKAPAILQEAGRRARKALERKHAAGERLEAFDARIYGHREVKKALRTMQHGKCCFCESKISHVVRGKGEVEHFRPKAGYRQSRGGKLQRPGYYWLAYEWSNLFLCCSLCNQRYKENLFPLANPRARARSHRDDIGREKPLFLDPAADDPEQFIGFRQEIPYAIRGNRRGKETIEALGLDREELAQERRDRLQTARVLAALAARLPGEPEAREARAMLDRWQKDDSAYAAMMRAWQRDAGASSRGRRQGSRRGSARQRPGR